MQDQHQKPLIQDRLHRMSLIQTSNPTCSCTLANSSWTQQPMNTMRKHHAVSLIKNVKVHLSPMNNYHVFHLVLRCPNSHHDLPISSQNVTPQKHPNNLLLSNHSLKLIHKQLDNFPIAPLLPALNDRVHLCLALRQQSERYRTSLFLFNGIY